MNKRKQQKEGKMVQNLPDDMIIEILSRLPAKSLYRFRCVSQSWLSLLRPNFIRINNNHQKLFFLFEKHYSILDLYETSSCSDVNAAMVNVEHQFPSLPNYFLDFPLCDVIQASYESWLLLCWQYPYPKTCELMLLNPFTREHKIFSSCNDSSGLDCFGICYDCSDNEYKVMRARQRDSDTSFHVFSFKTNSWTKVRDLTNWIADIDTFVFTVNGLMHFMCVLEADDRYVLLSFDLKGELKEVPQPDHKFEKGDCDLASVRGNLWLHGYVSDTYEMFEMEQYGVKESWIHVCSIKTRSGLGTIYQPLGFTKKGDVIIATFGKDLLIYNLEQDEFKTLNFEVPTLTRLATYSDSFITLSY